MHNGNAGVLGMLNGVKNMIAVGESHIVNR